MKPGIILLLTFFSLHARAQLTEASYRQLIDRYIADPVTVLKNETTADFRIISGNGNQLDLEALLNFYSRYSEGPRVFEDLKVLSDEKIASVTGVFIHIIIDRKSGERLQSKVYFQNTLVKANGIWKLANAQHTDYLPRFEQDKQEIIAVIEAETDAYIKADFDKNRSYHSRIFQKSYAYPAGIFTGEAYNTMLNEFWKTRKAMNVRPERKDWSVRVNRASAYVTYVQTIHKENGNPSVTYETRYLERENGEWKIVSVGVILPRP